MIDRLQNNSLFKIAEDSRLGKDSLENLLGMKISPSRFQSILIEMAQKVVNDENVGDLLRHYKENRFTKPCSLPQREIIKLEETMYQEIPKKYADIELSPLAPLGVNSILTGVSQRTILSTVRNVEVLADPTTSLSLECLNRLRLDNTGNDVINLSTSARCTRGQSFPDNSGFVPHFRVFALTSGSLEKNEEMNHKIIEHLEFYLNFIGKNNNTDRYQVRNTKVWISNINIMEKLIKKLNIDRKELGKHSQDSGFDVFKFHNIKLPTVVKKFDDINWSEIKSLGIEKDVCALNKISIQIEDIKSNYPDIDFGYDLSRIAGIGYYNGLCIKIMAENNQGDKFPLVDGGYSDWLAKLTTNRKAQFFSSGFGIELFGSHFKV